MGLENLSDQDLEKVANGHMELLSDEALAEVAGESQDSSLDPSLGENIGRAALAPLSPALAAGGREFLGGFLGADKHSGFGAKNLTEEAGRMALPTALGAAGAPAGPIGIGAGTAAGRSLQNVAQQTAAQFGLAKQLSPGELVAQPVAEGVGGAVGAKVAPVVLSKSASALRGGFKMLVKTITGISEEAFERNMSRALEVMTFARQGKEASDEAVAGAADDFINTINQYVEIAQAKYGKLVQKAMQRREGSGEAVRINLKQRLEQTIQQTRDDFAFGIGKQADDPLANIVTPEGAPIRPKAPSAQTPSGARTLKPGGADEKKFNKVMEQIGDLADATPEEVYLRQKYLNRQIGNEISKTAAGQEVTPLGVAFMRVHKQMRQILNDSLPELGEANSVYSGALELRDTLKPLLRSRRAAGSIKSALKVPGDKLGTAIRNAASKIKEGNAAINTMLDAQAGSEFAPAFGNLPRTGLAGAMGATAVFRPEVLAGLPLLSPRAVGEAIAAGTTKISGSVAKHLGQQGGGRIGAEFARKKIEK